MKNIITLLVFTLLAGLCMIVELQKMKPVAVSIGQNDTEISALALAGIGLVLGIWGVVYIFRPEKPEHENI